MTTRRAVLAGGAALALLPWRAGAAAAEVRAALDAARAARDPVAALRLLAPFDAARLDVGARLDLLTARAGLAVDRDLVARGIDPHAKPPVSDDPALIALLLRRKLGDGIDLAAIAQRLEREHARCDRRAAVLFDQLGVAGPTTGARFTDLWRDARFLYPDSDAGRDAAILAMNRWLTRLADRVPTLVGAVPAYCRNVTAIRPTPADLTAGHVGVRSLPTPDHAGGYVVDLTHVRDRPAWTLPSVVAHELLPGHMIQLPLEAAADPHPLRLDYAPAFAEGWGIYAEQLIARSGAYADDPRAELGQLHWRLFRIARARVDLALHLDGVSRDTAKALILAWQGEPAAFAPFDSDLARIAQEPMTRVAEMLAALAIEDGARGRNGAALHRYHHAMLDHGRMRSDALMRL